MLTGKRLTPIFPQHTTNKSRNTHRRLSFSNTVTLSLVLHVTVIPLLLILHTMTLSLVSLLTTVTCQSTDYPLRGILKLFLHLKRATVTHNYYCNYVTTEGNIYSYYCNYVILPCFSNKYYKNCRTTTTVVNTP